jgi:hypothetical protein
VNCWRGGEIDSLTGGIPVFFPPSLLALLSGHLKVASVIFAYGTLYLEFACSYQYVEICRQGKQENMAIFSLPPCAPPRRTPPWLSSLLLSLSQGKTSSQDGGTVTNQKSKISRGLREVKVSSLSFASDTMTSIDLFGFFPLNM